MRREGSAEGRGARRLRRWGGGGRGGRGGRSIGGEMTAGEVAELRAAVGEGVSEGGVKARGGRACRRAGAPLSHQSGRSASSGLLGVPLSHLGRRSSLRSRRACEDGDQTDAPNSSARRKSARVTELGRGASSLECGDDPQRAVDASGSFDGPSRRRPGLREEARSGSGPLPLLVRGEGRCAPDERRRLPWGRGFQVHVLPRTGRLNARSLHDKLVDRGPMCLPRRGGART